MGDDNANRMAAMEEILERPQLAEPEPANQANSRPRPDPPSEGRAAALTTVLAT